MISRVLLAANGSGCSARAMQMAAEIAGRFGAEIVVSCACKTTEADGGGLDARTPDEADAFLDGVVRELKDVGLSARSEVLAGCYGTSARELVALAESEGADLVVVSSIGPSGVESSLPGSLACEVLQLSSVPVLVVW